MKLLFRATTQSLDNDFDVIFVGSITQKILSNKCFITDAIERNLISTVLLFELMAASSTLLLVSMF